MELCQTPKISLFWMAMFPRVPHMGYTYLNLLDSPKLLQILVTLTAVIKPLLPNFLGRAIVILNFVRRFRNFIAGTVCFKLPSPPPGGLLYWPF